MAKQFLVGTSGYSYKEWKGNFYPDDLAATNMLAYYSSRLSAVEINNTFYRLPRRTVLEAWSASVPATFRFVLKASRRITHFKRLKPPYDETKYLIETAAVLGKRLGCILFQLPPNMRVDVGRLASFLEHLPAEISAAFEFRNESWFVDEVISLLRDHNRALVIADSEETPVVELTETADWGYLRLRHPDYDASDLKKWALRIKASAWKTAYVFFKHEEAGAGPLMASNFVKHLGGK